MPAGRDELERALRRLATKGVQTYWVVDSTPELLGLVGVQRRLSPGAKEDAQVKALIEYLDEDAIPQVTRTSYRAALRIIFAIDPVDRGTSAEVRFSKAGAEFRGGEDPVKEGTMRQHHFPKAIKKLVDIFLADERR